MTMNITIKYVCRICGSKWSRKVKSTSFQPLERPISAICPGCIEENGS